MPQPPSSGLAAAYVAAAGGAAALSSSCEGEGAIVSTPASGAGECVSGSRGGLISASSALFARLSVFRLLFRLCLLLSSSISHPLPPRAKLRSPWRRQERRICCRRASCCPSGPKSQASMSETNAVVAAGASRPDVALRRRWGARQASHRRQRGSTRERRNALRLIFTREQDAGAKALWNGEKKSEQSEREHLPNKKKQKGNSMSITLIPFLSLSGGRRSLLF